MSLNGVDALGLAIGKPVTAIVNGAVGDDALRGGRRGQQIGSSARNQLAGVVEHVDHGAVSCKVGPISRDACSRLSNGTSRRRFRLERTTKKHGPGWQRRVSCFGRASPRRRSLAGRRAGHFNRGRVGRMSEAASAVRCRLNLPLVKGAASPSDPGAVRRTTAWQGSGSKGGHRSRHSKIRSPDNGVVQSGEPFRAASCQPAPDAKARV